MLRQPLSALIGVMVVAGCIGVVSEPDSVGDQNPPSAPWEFRVEDTAVLVRVVADEEWSIHGYGELDADDDEGFWAGIHQAGFQWPLTFIGYAPEQYEAQIMTEEHEFRQKIPNLIFSGADNRTFEVDRDPGEYHFVLWAHNLTFDFTIESAEVELVALDRDMFRYRTYIDGEWDYEMHVYLWNTLSYSAARTHVETNHEYVQIVGSATSALLPNGWEVTTAIGDHECDGYTAGPDWLRFDHHGTGDVRIEAKTEIPDRGHHQTLWIFDLPLDPPEPYCRSD